MKNKEDEIYLPADIFIYSFASGRRGQVLGKNSFVQLRLSPHHGVIPFPRNLEALFPAFAASRRDNPPSIFSHYSRHAVESAECGSDPRTFRIGMHKRMGDPWCGVSRTVEVGKLGVPMGWLKSQAPGISFET